MIKINSSLGGIKFGVDENGNYGYIKAGADSVTPFSTIKYLIKNITLASSTGQVTVFPDEGYKFEALFVTRGTFNGTTIYNACSFLWSKETSILTTYWETATFNVHVDEDGYCSSCDIKGGHEADRKIVFWSIEVPV